MRSRPPPPAQRFLAGLLAGAGQAGSGVTGS